MTNIKLTLSIAVVIGLLFGGVHVYAKENKGKNDQDKVEKLEIVLLTSTTTATATTSPTIPVATATPVTATSTEPVTTSTAPIATTTTPAAQSPLPTPKKDNPSFFTPIINFFTPAQPKKTATTSSTTPAIVGSSGQVNNTLGDGFFASNYYTSGAFSAGTTKSLKFLGLFSGIIGLALLGSRALTTKYYS